MDSFLGNSILVLAVTAASRSLCCERLLLANGLGIQEHQIQWVHSVVPASFVARIGTFLVIIFIAFYKPELDC